MTCWEELTPAPKTSSQTSVKSSEERTLVSRLGMGKWTAKMVQLEKCAQTPKVPMVQTTVINSNTVDGMIVSFK